jgi:plastocyanin
MSDPVGTEAMGGGVTEGTGSGGWKSFLRTCAIASVIVVALINIFAGIIPPLIVFALLWVIGLFWLAKATKGPAILLLVVLVLYMALSLPFILPAMMVPASAGDFILNLAAVLAAIGGVVAAIFVIRGRVEPSDSPRTLGRVLIGLFVVGTLVSIFSLVTYEDATMQEGDVELVARDIEFEQTSLEADSGEVAVFVKNEDSTLHTFTIEELDVDLNIPAGKSARVTFDAEPGTYEFFCVPHKEDMKGTIEIR